MIVDELYVGLHLALDQIPTSNSFTPSTPARHALSRLPSALLALPISQSLFSLLASVSERKYTQVYPRAQALREMVSPPSVPNADLGQTLIGLIDAFVGEYPH